MKTFRTKLLTMATLLCSITANSQDFEVGVEALALEQNDDYAVDVSMPEFPGGMQALMTYLQKNVKYPSSCYDQGIQGRVITQFVVDTTGYIVDPVLFYSVDPALDSEALRVVKAMPKWTPGTQNGKKVRVKYTLPMSFTVSRTSFEVDGNTYEITSSSGLTVELAEMQDSETVSIPESVTYYGKNYSVTSIRNDAFYDCTNLTSLTIPNSVTNIGLSAFVRCPALAYISVAEGNPVYDSRGNCNAIIKTNTNELVLGCRTTVIPNSVTSIGTNAFNARSGLTSVTLLENVKEIKSYAFGRCSELTSFTIPNSVTGIGTRAFISCSGLTSITIPENVTTIGNDAFQYCSNLSSVTLNCKQIGSWFSNSKTIKEVILGNTVTSIGSRAFCNCSALNTIIIPNSVTSIGDWAFYGCSSLLSANLPNNLTKISKGTFNFCSGLASVSIPDGVTEIGGWAFDNCSSLTSVEIPNSVEKMDTSAFRLCTALKTVKLPKNLKRVGDWNFYGCPELASIEIPNSVEEIGTCAFSGCTSLATVTIPDDVKKIGGWAFLDCSGLTSVSLPNNITKIDTATFANCSSLGSVKIPNSVTEIAASAFEGCLNMSSVDIPDGLKTLGDWGFCSCPSLTSVILPSSLTNIGKRAFLGCFSLREITNFSTIPQSLIVDEFGVFGDVDKTNCILRVPTGTKKSYQAADVWKDFLNIEEFDATGIKGTMFNTEDGDAPIYNLHGVRMNENKENLPAGIYIQGGKKIVVK